jgi:uncharacterized Fe-S cluster protein YjdI
MENIVKKYSNGEVAIIWEPKKCIHSGICVKGLPDVFKPKDKPWIEIDKASTQKLINQVKQCPSGALGFEMVNEDVKESLETKIEALPNGPLLVYGTLKITDSKGNEHIKNKTTAFCRCGSSKNKPFCDGAHVVIDFKD